MGVGCTKNQNTWEKTCQLTRETKEANQPFSPDRTGHKY